MGVFLFHELRLDLYRGLPHACGGVSFISTAYTPLYLSSPRMWGCFRIQFKEGEPSPVFPTHVGVFPAFLASEALRMCLPHACGGVSFTIVYIHIFGKSSPRMWGCFLAELTHMLRTLVFPTHVGVFLLGIISAVSLCRLPHACGGVSLGESGLVADRQSSPRMWGCFYKKRLKLL